MEIPENIVKCYKCDNNFAYKYDYYLKNNTLSNKKKYVNNMKIYNFVPTYDKWCLFCDNKYNV